MMSTGPLPNLVPSSQELFLLNLLQSTPDHVYFKDQQSQFLQISTKLAQLLGLHTPEEAIGKSDFDFFTYEHANAAFMAEQRIIETGEPLIGIEEKETWLDGRVTWVTTTKMPLRNEEGKIIGIFGISRDITAQKLAEIERQKAQELAENSNRAKTQFLVNMSHEIRTPLNGIIGMTDLMLGTAMNPEQKDFLETIHSSGENLLAIINNVLDFSQIEHDQLQLDFHTFNLLDLVHEVVRLFNFRAQGKKLELKYHIDSQLSIDYWGDATRIRQVLVNLVTNAIKFTELGEVRIDISPGTPRPHDPSDLQRLFFCVTDTGVGIPPEKLERAFKGLSQIDTSAARRHESGGLGLAVCQRLVELMGGTIQIETIVNKGSIFSFELPLRLAHQLSESAELERNFGLSGHRVLIVDDIETSRRMLFANAPVWHKHNRKRNWTRRPRAIAARRKI